MFVVGLDLHVLDNIALITNTLIDIAKNYQSPQKKVYVVIIRFYVLFDKIMAFSFIQLINQIEEDGLNNAV